MNTAPRWTNGLPGSFIVYLDFFVDQPRGAIHRFREVNIFRWSLWSNSAIQSRPRF